MLHRRGTTSIGIALLAVAAAGGPAWAQDGAGAAAQPLLGTSAPGFELKTVGGETLSLGDLKGRYVVIHFGASW